MQIFFNSILRFVFCDKWAMILDLCIILTDFYDEKAFWKTVQATVRVYCDRITIKFDIKNDLDEAIKNGDTSLDDSNYDEGEDLTLDDTDLSGDDLALDDESGMNDTTGDDEDFDLEDLIIKKIKERYDEELKKSLYSYSFGYHFY